jgi:hypothetical protein
MTDDALDRVLRLVAEGRLTAEEAGPILDALAANPDRSIPTPPRPPDAPEPPPPPGGRRATAVRIEITEDGRKTVNLRVPVALGRFALDHVPGITTESVGLIRSALEEGRSGPILVLDDGDGDGVRIVLE